MQYPDLPELIHEQSLEDKIIQPTTRLQTRTEQPLELVEDKIIQLTTRLHFTNTD